MAHLSDLPLHDLLLCNEQGPLLSVEQAFAEDGSLTDEKNAPRVQAACKQLMHFARVEANRSVTCPVMAQLMTQSNSCEYGSVSVTD